MRISDWSSDVCSSDLCSGSAYRSLQLELNRDPVQTGKVEPTAGDVAPDRHQVRTRLREIDVDRIDLLDRRQRGAAGGAHQRAFGDLRAARSEEHTSELQSLMRISYAVFCLKKKNHQK